MKKILIMALLCVLIVTPVYALNDASISKVHIEEISTEETQVFLRIANDDNNRNNEYRGGKVMIYALNGEGMTKRRVRQPINAKKSLTKRVLFDDQFDGDVKIVYYAKDDNKKRVKKVKYILMEGYK